MPRLSRSLPKYRRHKASGQAVVTLNGRDHYLGPHGTRASHREYDRLIAEWLAGGRTPLRISSQEITIVEVVDHYWRHAMAYYQKDGRPTRELANIKIALSRFVKLYGQTLASEFGPRSLKTLKEQLVALDHSGSYVNKQIAHIKRMFKWAASEELVSARSRKACRRSPA